MVPIQRARGLLVTLMSGVDADDEGSPQAEKVDL